MKKHLSTILLVIVFFFGLSLLLYPVVSDYWNSFHQSRAIASYTEQIANMDEDNYKEFWAAAHEYNSRLSKDGDRFILTEEEKEEYNALLNVTGSGIMGYIHIPAIDCTLPVYHGTSEAVLQIAVGHIEGSSLPTGGEGTHCVLSGHRGLPSAKLFTDLDKMVIGDTFLLNVLDETLTYEVDQIRIVEPHEMEALAMEDGQDLCTLITCTPYGINTHRLLVRGHRVETVLDAPAIHVKPDAWQVDPAVVAPFVAVPILLVLLLWLLISTRKKKN